MNRIGLSRRSLGGGPVNDAVNELIELEEAGGCGVAQRFFAPETLRERRCPVCGRRYPYNRKYCPECVKIDENGVRHWQPTELVSDAIERGEVKRPQR